MVKNLLEAAAEKVISWLREDEEMELFELEEYAGRELPDNPVGDSIEVEEEPEEIPLHDALYYFGDDTLMEVDPSYHFRSIHTEHEGDVEILGARPYSGIDGFLVRYLDQDNQVREANPDYFRLSDEQERELVGEAYGGMLGSGEIPASFRDDKYTPDTGDGIMWLEGEGQAEKREPLSTLYSTKDTRELLFERVALPGDEGEILREFLDEAWLKYAEDADLDPEEGGIYREEDAYRLESEHVDLPIGFTAEETERGYRLEPLDSRLSTSEDMVLQNVFERFTEIAGHYRMEQREEGYEVIRTA